MNNDKFSLLKFTLIVLLFLGFIIGWLGFGERGFIHLYRKEKERQAYLKKINKLEKDNQELLEEIHRLKTDKAYVESVARQSLGLVKDDEILYRFNREQGDGETDGSVKDKTEETELLR